MGVSLLEVIESAGYDITTLEDANWLLSKQSEFDELIEKAEEIVEDVCSISPKSYSKDQYAKMAAKKAAGLK